MIEQNSVFHHRMWGAFTDVSGARDWMRRVCGPHDLVVRPGRSLRFVHAGDQLGALSTAIGCIEYGTDVRIDIQGRSPLDRYSISLPLSGEQALRIGGHVIGSDPEHGLIIDPSAHQELSISGHCRKLLVAIDRGAMHSVLSQMLGHPVHSPIAFEPCIAMDQSAAHTWWRWVRLLWEDMGHQGNLMHHNALALGVETSLIQGLLSFQRHNYSDQLAQVQQQVLPRHVAGLKNTLIEHAREDVDMEALVSAQGFSSRRMSADFRAHMGLTPTQFLRQHRLQQARLDIVRSASTKYISEIALAWGFEHLGRFAQAYRDAFGESPSATAQRHRPQG
ncbi:AraC family transcriptional regulator [Curvibacter sp. RS43]|uniref:AraC family transcriptional regulator n=1 Tax=Curvibacter microcysteis TaxID=3026419 RepID=UPI00235F4C4A|nr:AraC family transcriptional regulator [Curvibacter sp. RS43]MDD0812702.1 AraC family transcriptional regulator [Curvibacter sp. RS43]